MSIFFKVAVQECGGKSYNDINDHPDDPSFGLGIHKNYFIMKDNKSKAF
jgi:hypothetical protein